MNGDRNYGLIIRHLRKQSNMSVRQCALAIGKSIGWLSEVENGKGRARLTEREFNRIVDALDGSEKRDQFRTWVATAKRNEGADRTFDGAVLKYIRVKKGIRLREASALSCVSVARLSKIERGLVPATVDLRNQIMKAYGYSPSSFKNLSSDPVRSRKVPVRYKLQIVLKSLSDTQIEYLLQIVRTLDVNQACDDDRHEF